jgi:hypothetical protein
MRRRHVRQIVTGLASAGILTAAATGPLSAAPALMFEHAGFDTFMQDERDQRFEDALAMLPARLSDLRHEIPDLEDMPQPVLDLVFDLMPRPMQIIVEPSGTDPNTGMPSAGIFVAFGAESQEEAKHLADRIAGFVEASPAQIEFLEDEDDPMQRLIMTPIGPASFGPASVGGKWWLRMQLGQNLDVAAAHEAYHAVPDGVAPVARGRVDMRMLSPMIGMGLAFAGPEGQMIASQLAQTGILGPDAIAWDFMEGFTEDGIYGRIVVERQGLAPVSLVPREPILERDLRVIPQDASVAVVSKMELMGLWDLIDSAIAMSGMDLEEVEMQLEDMVGVNLRDDLVEPLGSTWTWYTSNTTGGDTMMSSAMLISLDDPERIRNTFEHLIGMANHQLAEIKYVEIAKTQAWGQSLYTLRMRGLPIPIELSFAIEGDHLIAGMAPQAVIAGGRQIAEGETSLLDNRRFRRNFPREEGRQYSSITFLDARTLAPDGYPLLQLMGSAVANGMRSPLSDRDPGIVIPPYNDLMKNAKPVMMWAYWDGDDYITEYTADRSMLVRSATMAGYLGRSPLMLAIGAGVMIPAIMGVSEELDLDLEEMIEDISLVEPASEPALIELVEGPQSEALLITTERSRN